MQPDPVHVCQFDAGARGPYLCTAASGAMALDAFTSGRIRVGAARIDELQNDHDRNGIGLNDVAVAWKAGWDLTFSNGRRSWTTVAKRLQAGDGAVLQGSYAVVPAKYKAQANFNGGHAIYAARYTGPGLIQVHDPIRRSKTVWPESVVRNFYLSGLAAAGWGTGKPGSGTGGGSGGGGATVTAGLLDEFLATIGRSQSDLIRDEDVVPFVKFMQSKGLVPGGSPANPLIAAFDRSVRNLVGQPWSSVGQGLLDQATAPDPFGIVTAVNGAVGALGDVVVNAVWLIAILVVILLGAYMLARSGVE